MVKRTFALLLLLVAVVVVVLLASAAAATPTQKKPPNIVLFIVDDLGYGEVNAHNASWAFPRNALTNNNNTAGQRVPRRTGLQVIVTRNLARMASQGIRAVMSYAPSSICAPSRASIFLERHVGVIKCIRGNRFTSTHELVMPVGAPRNFVHELQQAGYDTAYFGKWGLGTRAGGPWNHGFAQYAGQLFHIEAHTYFPHYYYEYDAAAAAAGASSSASSTPEIAQLKVPIPANQRRRWTDKTCPLTPNSTCVHINDVMVNNALEFIIRHGEAAAATDQTNNTTGAQSNNNIKPFFLVLSPTYPHVGTYSSSNDDNSANMIAPVKIMSARRLKQRPRVMRGHASQIEQHLDRDVGRVLDALQHFPDTDNNTLFIFTSDNGPPLDKSIYTPAGGLRGAKRDMYEGGIRVPTILRWPSVFPAGVVSTAPFALYDLGPTFREMANLPMAPTQDADGNPTLSTSMLEAWKTASSDGNRFNQTHRRYLHIEQCDWPGDDGECASATLDLAHYVPGNKVFKLVHFARNARARPVLFELSSSPNERTASKFKVKREELVLVRRALRSQYKDDECV